MAIFHLHAQYIGRSEGRSAVAASAYRSASKLVEQSVDKESGYVFEKTHDYRHKGGVVFSEIIVPDEHALWMKDREELWNKVQVQFEKRKDAVLAHDKDIALPVELTLEQNLELLKDFVNEAFTKEGIVADVNVHYDNEDNPHVHIMHSTREIIFDDNLGESGEYTFGKKVRYWDSKEFLVNARRLWAQKVNEHLKLHGIDKEISHLSYKELGIDLIPGIKEGAGRRIEGSERGQMNADIAMLNEKRILDNPELIIDVLRKDRAVFTKEDISKALMEHVREDLYSGADFPGGDLSASIDSSETSGISDIKHKSGELVIPGVRDEMQSIGKYINALNKVLQSDKIMAVGAKDLEGRILYTSKARYELEQDLLGVMKSLKDEVDLDGASTHNLGVSIDEIGSKGVVGNALDNLLLRKGLVLSDKQKQVVFEVINSGNVSVVEGLPGSGKTTVMQEVVRQYKKAGYEVVGSAVSSSASMELAEKAGIAAFNITKFRYDTEKLRGMIEGSKDFNVNLKIDYYKDYFDGVPEEMQAKSLLSSKSVLIVDEASMVDLTELHFVMSEVRRAGAKLILLGDRAQLTSVGIAGGLEKAADMYGISRLDEVRRQRDPEHSRATELLSSYKVSEAIRLQNQSGVFSIAHSMEEARERLVKDYVADFTSNVNDAGYMDKTIMALAYTNEDVRKLNSSIRGRLKDSGVVYGKEFDFEKSGGEGNISLAKGDRIVFDQNSSWMGVSNGDTGRIVGFGEREDKHGWRETVIVRLDSEEKYLGVSVPIDVEVDNHFYKGLSYGFAITISKSQGRTYNSTYGLLNQNTGYNAYLVMCTRHKDSLKVYASGSELEEVLLKRVDFDVEKAKREWNLYTSDKRQGDLPYAGIAAIVYKRGDRSLSDDYKRDVLTDPRAVVANYLEVRGEALKLENTIWHWLSAEKLKERYGKSDIAKEKEVEFREKQKNGEIGKNKVWEGLDREHHPLYSELEDLLEKRQELAGEIFKNSAKYTKILTQAEINMVTVEKHALMSAFEFKLRKNLPSGKMFGKYEDNRKLYDMLDSLEKLSKYEVGPLFDRGESYQSAEAIRSKVQSLSCELLKSYSERRLDIEALNIENKKISLRLHEKQAQLIESQEFVQSSIKKFFETTYKETPEEILEKWNSIKENALSKVEVASQDVANNATTELGDALEEVRKNPQILGSLKGKGLGAALAFTPTRFRATVNLEGVADRLERYEKERVRISEITEWKQDASVKLKDITRSIKEAQSGLVGTDLEKFILEANKFAGGSSDSYKHSDKASVHESALRSAILWSKKPFNSEKIGLFKEILDSSKQFNKDHAQSISKPQSPGKSFGAKTSANILFDDVASKLGSSQYEAIFRKYVSVLNPADSIERKANKITCGTINMDLKTGLWHRFSTGEGGNIFGLVREAEGCSKYESLIRVASDIGMSTNASSSMNRADSLSVYSAKVSSTLQDKAEIKNDWVPFSEIPKKAPQFKANVHLKYMLEKNDIGAVHDYKDKEGKIIGHTVRMMSKEDESKQVLPVSYCHNEALDKDGWRLKGFADSKGGKPIYGLEKLYSPNTKDKPVLIVEGEKTADAATKLLPEYNVISWLGGSQNASKVDWSHMAGRDVAVWPDNDETGIKCAKFIASDIKALDAKDGNVWVINPHSLFVSSDAKVKSNLLPVKWDLADDLPDGLSIDDIKGNISKAININNRSGDILQAKYGATFDKEALSRISAQQTYLCYNISSVELESQLSKYKALEDSLTSVEVKEYVKYAFAKGEFEKPHEFMQIDNKLYREALISIGMSDKSIPLDSEELSSSDLLLKLEEKYQDRVSSTSDHLEVNREYIKVFESSGRSGEAKSELFKILSRDVMLLHKLQLEESLGKGNAYLPDAHREVIKGVLYDLVRDARAGSRDDISLAVMRDIADKAYEKLCKGDFWSEITDRSLEKVDGKGAHNLEQGANTHAILIGIREITGSDKIQSIEDQIINMPDKIKEDYLEIAFNNEINNKYGSALSEISKNRADAKDVDALVNIASQERGIIEDLKSNYPSAYKITQERVINQDLSRLISNYSSNDEMKLLLSEFENLKHFGLEVNNASLDEIRNAAEPSRMAERIRALNVNHVIWTASEDIAEIGKVGFVKVDDQRYADPESYLTHKSEDKKFKEYLDQTIIPDLANELDTKFGYKLDEIEALDSEVRIGQIKARLCIPEEEKADQIIIEALADAFENEVGSYLEGFKEAKENAHDIGELTQHISKEHEFVDIIFRDYPNAVLAYEEVSDSRDLSALQLISEDKPEFIENMMMDVRNIGKFGIEINEDKFDELRDGHNEHVADTLFNLCKEHLLERMDENLHELKYEDHIEVNGMKFSNRMSYISHEYYENHMDRYLEGTKYGNAIREMHSHCMEHDISEEEYMEMDHIKDLDKGMSL